MAAFPQSQGARSVFRAPNRDDFHGVYDLIGNVMEWCDDAVVAGDHVAMGGRYNIRNPGEPAQHMAEGEAVPADTLDGTLGFRCFARR